MNNSTIARKREEVATRKAYKTREDKLVNEQLHEMHTVFGTGHTIKNAITGRKTKL